jgi:hypothetical protein
MLSISQVAHATTRALLASALCVAPLSAQTDFWNTDAGRPGRIEDALVVERHAFELQAAPLRLSRASGGRYDWGIEPELAWGILPRTQVELAFPLAFLDEGGATRAGLAGIELSALHSLNAETMSLPAFALGAGAVFPAGGLAAERTFAAVKGIVTRTTSLGRLHLNGEYTLGGRVDAASLGAEEVALWTAGMAVDRAIATRSLLLMAELLAEEGIARGSDVEWQAGTGVRWQAAPRWALDAGVAWRFTDDTRWSLTFGSAYAFGIPGRGRRGS